MAATHLLTFLFWQTTIPLTPLLEPGAEAICWPFLPACHAWRVLSAGQWEVVLWAYLALGVASVALFARAKLASWAWWVLLALNVVKLLIVLQDFQLRQNQHYMAGLASAVFLFVPGKRLLLRVLVASFYAWAGLLKLNAEWLSGAALPEPVWLFEGRWLAVACSYVVALEVLLIWGMFSRRGWVFWSTALQLAAFHVFSWPIVGFFYPTLMFLLLAIFVLDRRWPATAAPRLGRAGMAVLLLFSAAQVKSHVVPGDSALTGEGRLFAVHMFDALVQCEATALVKTVDGRAKRVNLFRPLPARIRCDPLIYWNRANQLCRQLKASGVGGDLDLTLRSRRSSDPEMTPVLDVRRYCALAPAYSIWFHNPWILSESGRSDFGVPKK